jgi:hypothetical protein
LRPSAPVAVLYIREEDPRSLTGRAGADLCRSRWRPGRAPERSAPPDARRAGRAARRDCREASGLRDRPPGAPRATDRGRRAAAHADGPAAAGGRAGRATRAERQARDVRGDV